MDETWRQLSLLFSEEFNAPTISAGRRGLLWSYALLAAIAVGTADLVLGQGITFLPLYLFVIAPLSFYEGFFAGVAAAWLVCFISLGVDIVGRGALTGYLFYLRTGLHLVMFVVVAGAASWIGRIYTKLKDLSIRDGLTGLYNHTYFKTRLAEELSRAARFKRPLSISLFDLDHFKSCNDTYGHEIGNELLREVADLLKGNLREVDLAARYGGDEFVVLFPETSWGLALEAADRLRGVVERHRFLFHHDKGPLAITMSGGIAALDRARSTTDLLLDAADRSLYKAKADGRNKICG